MGSRREAIARGLKLMEPRMGHFMDPDHGDEALTRERVACDLAEWLTAEARFAAWRRSHG